MTSTLPDQVAVADTVALLRACTTDLERDGANADWTDLLDHFCATPTQTLLAAYQYIDRTPDGQVPLSPRRATLEVTARALYEFCNDAEIVTALGVFATHAPAVALHVARALCTIGLQVNASFERDPSNGALTKSIYANLYTKHGSAGLNFVLGRLFESPARVTPACRDLATTLFQNWEGTLDSLIETVRELAPNQDQVLSAH